MIDYAHYLYIIASVISIIGMIRYKVSIGKVINSIAMFAIAYWVLRHYPYAYLVIGSILAMVMAIVASFSEPFKSKGNFLADLKDISVTVLMIAISLFLWMQIICINLYVDQSRLNSD